MFSAKFIYWLVDDWTGKVYAQSPLHILVNAFIEYVHPTNWLNDNASVLMSVLADIDGELNVTLNIKLEPDGSCVSSPWMIIINRILHIPIDVLLEEGSYPSNVKIWLPTVTL